MEVELSDPLKAVETWFHLFRSMIDSGDMAKMGPSAFACYCVIKSNTDFRNGKSFPGVEFIATKSGVSERQVKRELQVLEKMGYITKERAGRNNLYTLREKVAIHDDTGRPVAEATWDYIPSSVKQAMADLKNVLVTGDLAGARIVNIQHLQIQIIQGENNTGMMVQEKDVVKMPEKIRKQFEEMKKNRSSGETIENGTLF